MKKSLTPLRLSQRSSQLGGREGRGWGCLRGGEGEEENGEKKGREEKGWILELSRRTRKWEGGRGGGGEGQEGGGWDEWRGEELCFAAKPLDSR